MLFIVQLEEKIHENHFFISHRDIFSIRCFAKQYLSIYHGWCMMAQNLYLSYSFVHIFLYLASVILLTQIQYIYWYLCGASIQTHWYISIKIARIKLILKEFTLLAFQWALLYFATKSREEKKMILLSHASKTKHAK